MKDQYFGDVSDYRKYGLLRALQSSGHLKLLVAWMMTPDDTGRDGGKRAYLDQPKWQHFDPELYDGLASALKLHSKPKVSLIENCKLLSRSTFYSEEVPDSCEERIAWRNGLMKKVAGVDVVFFDPDNGIEIPSKPIGRKGSSKFVAWKEIKDVWHAGKSLLIYQHFNRQERGAFTKSLISKLREKLTGQQSAWAFKTSHVLFLLIAQKKHRAVLQEAITTSLPRWRDQIQVMIGDR